MDAWSSSASPVLPRDHSSPGRRAKSCSSTIPGEPSGRAASHLSPAKPMLLPFRISIQFDGSLEILNATKNDEGVYTCFAENGRGKANSSGYLTITGQRSQEIFAIGIV